MSTESKTWTPTNRKNLYRHHTGTYYARLRLNGKQTWRSLRTKVKGVAESKLDELRATSERQAENPASIGELRTMNDLLRIREAEIENDPSKKKSTKRYWREIHSSLRETWPDFDSLSIRKISPDDCSKWSAKFASTFSNTRYNNAVAALKGLFTLAISHGARHTNPAEHLKRLKPSEKDLTNRLPERTTFHLWVKEIRTSPNRWRHACGDLVEFLSYSGLRIGEARNVYWKHLDFQRSEIVVEGDPEEGTKNRSVRRVPMIPAMVTLLDEIKQRRLGAICPGEPVLVVSTARKAMNRAADILGIPHLTHHDLRHFFATTCIESGVDIPTVSRWLGHKDGGALAMRVYGHLRNEHSLAEAKKVSFS